MTIQEAARLSLALGVVTATVACSVSQQEEQEIGAYEAAQADSQLPLLGDTAITRYVTTLGRSMADRTSRAGLEWRFTVVNTPEINAFALPGGFIYVTRGLIEQADSVDELAGVMAHEIGHVVQRHSVEQLKKGAKRDVGLVLLCTLTHACDSPGRVIAIQTGADALTARYSRRDEAQADSEAVVITVSAGIDPEGMPAFFKKLIARRTEQPTAAEVFFSTHPTDEVRISALRHQIDAFGSLSARGLVRDTPEFHVMQARVRAQPPPPSTTTQ